MSDIEKIKSDLRCLLSEYRYLHSLRVAEVAKGLAARYSFDIDKAYATGLIHDIAKEFTYEENLDIIKRYHLPMSLLHNNYHKILHSDIGAIVVRERYGLDEEISHAIFCHTTGDIPMGLLDRILFVADKIEPGKQYNGIEEERRLAYTNLNDALILCIENNQKKLIKEKKNICPRSIRVLKYLKEERDNL